LALGTDLWVSAQKLATSPLRPEEAAQVETVPRAAGLLNAGHALSSGSYSQAYMTPPPVPVVAMAGNCGQTG
jgi:hypothetical protein